MCVALNYYFGEKTQLPINKIMIRHRVKEKLKRHNARDHDRESTVLGYLVMKEIADMPGACS